MPRFVGFIGPTYTLEAVDVDCQRCINLYPELNELGTGKDKEIASLVGAPGLSLLATLPVAGHRGSLTASNGQVFMVAYNKLYKVLSDFTYTELGTLVTTSGNVSLADNGLQLVVVDGPNGYVWDFTLLTFTQISSPNFFGSDKVLHQDGYFVFNKPGTSQFYLSDLEAATFTTIPQLISPLFPNIVEVVSFETDHRNLWVLGPRNYEVFFNSGAVFPFEYVQGSCGDVGCAAAFSVASLNGTLVWLGQDKRGSGTVYEASGYQPVRISNQAVELAIQSYSTISDAVAWTYSDAGHNFYVLNFPTANATWVFDSQTKLWHERAYLLDGNLLRHRGQTHTYAFGKHIVGDWENGKVYELTRSVYSDDGAAMFRRRRAPHISTDMNRQFFSEFQLDLETGVGIDGLGQGTDPQVILRWSDDGGHTWSNEKWTAFGKIGRKRARAAWQRLGSARNRVFEVTITDPVKTTIIGAEINFAVGTS